MAELDKDWIKGSYTRQKLLNTYFEHTELFSPAANEKIKTGRYCDAVYNSRAYRRFWQEEVDRCKNGYVNPVTKVWIPGYYYFYLNYKQLMIIKEPNNPVSPRTKLFPRFWGIHYWFFISVQEAIDAGKHMCILKPRGTGFSELMSSMGARDYTFDKTRPSFYFASNEGYLNKDGILTKTWDNLEFLNSETERAFRHLRQKKNSDLHKKASKIDTLTGNEIVTGGEIIGRVVDNPNKVRGGRGNVYFEESGSFPHIDKAWNIVRPLVEQGGITFGTILAFGTGGESGKGILGFENIFKNPQAYNCIEFENHWENDAIGKPCGFFFPAWSVMDKFMDKWGNTDFEAAKKYHEEERARIRTNSPQKEDARIAEYPFTISEALLRKAGNGFPLTEIQKQLTYVENSPDIKGFLKNGNLVREKDGTVKFQLDPNAIAVDSYPHQDGDDIKGCFTLLESPFKEGGVVPNNLYQIVVDPYYRNQAKFSTSLGAIYVYKKTNNISPTEDNMLVAWYVGRPKTTNILIKNLFMLAEFYNARIQSETQGGGKAILDYARSRNLLKYCDFEPTMFSSNKEIIKVTNRNYFINMNKERKLQALQDLADWLVEERALKLDGEEASYEMNIHKIYDKGLLEELLKFNNDGNFDRISALLLLMCMRKEMEVQQLKQVQKSQSNFFSRPLFTDKLVDNGNALTLNQMLGKE